MTATLTPTVTPMEADVLRGIVHNDYDRPVWAWTLAGGTVSRRQIGGVVSSLVQKGLVWCQGDGNEAIVDLTPLGEQVYAALPKA